MIETPVESIDVATLEALVQNGVSEGKTLEYKRELPLDSDQGKGKFLTIVCAFANADGGDLVIGVDEDKGAPTKLVGLENANIDRETVRMEQILRSGLEPRVPGIEIHPIALGNEKWVMIVRVPASWTAPHRVRETRKFHIRHSAGVCELDVGEIRTAFALSETLVQRIEDFRADRIGRIHSGRTPVVLGRNCCMVVHVVPIGAFRKVTAIDIVMMETKGKFLHPLGGGGFSDFFPNLHGLLTVARGFDEGVRAYTQIFRTGAVEGVYVLPVNDDGPYVPSIAYEEYVLSFVASYLKCTQDFDIEPPYYVFLSLVATKGCRFFVGPMLSDRAREVREDVVCVPEAVIRDREVDLTQSLRPVFDTVWNIFGYSRSMVTAHPILVAA